MPQDTQYVTAVTKSEFNPASLTGTFQALNGTGFTDTVRIWKLYNPSLTVSMDLSFDGVTAHDFIPPLGTVIIDFQANHDATASFGTGVKKLKKGQIVYGRTATNPTFLQIIGFS